MSNSTYYAHTNPIFAQHQILPYDLLIKQSQLSLMHSIHNNHPPRITLADVHPAFLLLSLVVP
jgi:hypothetical protein